MGILYAGRPRLPLLLIVLAACAPASTPVEPDFLGVEWVVVEVDGIVVEADTTHPAPTLLVSRTDQRASGHAGCNQVQRLRSGAAPNPGG